MPCGITLLKYVQINQNKKPRISLFLLVFISANRDFSMGYDRKNKKIFPLSALQSGMFKTHGSRCPEATVAGGGMHSANRNDYGINSDSRKEIVGPHGGAC
jgi:hypothetical protein